MSPAYRPVIHRIELNANNAVTGHEMLLCDYSIDWRSITREQTPILPFPFTASVLRQAIITDSK